MTVLANTDAYKLSHKGFMDEGTEYIYSNMTPRNTKYMPVLTNRYDKKVVWFGMQLFIKEYLIEEWNDKFFSKNKSLVISKFKRIVDAYLGEGAVDMSHFEALHDLQFLPIEIRSLPEGSCVNEKVPFFTIVNTDPRFAWLTNYLETVMSCELWKPSTVATIAREYRLLVNEFAMKTTGSIAGTEFQIHGFEFRGMSGRHDAAKCAAAFLLSSNGTDTVPAIPVLEDYYNADCTKEFIAASVPASEHSIACLGTSVKGELASYRQWITVDYPTGIVSLVSDTYDYFKVLTEFLPQLKDEIMARQPNAIGLNKVVIRPDSGDPVEIICGIDIRVVNDKWMDDANDFDEWKDIVAEEMDEQFNNNLEAEDPHYSFGDKVFSVKYTPDLNRHDKQYYYVDNCGDTVEKCTFTLMELTPEQKGSIEILWDIFGGTTSDEGYKILDEHIGLIYGDSITLARAEEIFTRLAKKGFASTNVVLGVGSYSMQYITRDSAGMAVKATWAQVNGEGYNLFKDPKTDDGTKKSAKGLLRVSKEGDGYRLWDQQTEEESKTGELRPVFVDGKLLVDDTLQNIRNRLWGEG